MTTVIADHECMAADQRITDSGPMAHMVKIRPIGNALFGFAGEVSPALLMLKWLEGNRVDVNRLHKLIPEDSRYTFHILELSPSGLALWDGWGVRVPLLDKVYAIGTGASAALSAVEDHGKDPAEAVRCAIRRDECSGLYREPQVEYLLPQELKAKPKARRKRGG